MKLADIKLNPNNPRKVDEVKFKKLVKSLKEFPKMMELRPIVIDFDNIIIGGNMRFKALTELGYTDIPDNWVRSAKDFTEAQIREFIIRDNISYGLWDIDALQEQYEIEELQDWGLDELDFKAENIDPVEDEIPDVDNVETRAKLGDVWQLGNHRIMCGDSTVSENIAKLLQEDQVHLIVTDPPYGVNYDPEWRDGCDLGVGKRSKGKVKNDDIIDWSATFSLINAPVMYVWHAAKFGYDVAKGLLDCGYDIISQIIWAKQHFVLSRGDYHWQHETCWYTVKKGEKHNWQGARDQSTVWNIKNNNSFGNAEKEETWGHGTQKPVECMLRPILNNSSKGDVICDPFLGSGTTLIAAEQSSRRCLGLEIDPLYVDVILARWEKFTGKKAELLVS